MLCELLPSYQFAIIIAIPFFRDVFIFVWTNQVCQTIRGARRDFFLCLGEAVCCWKFVITLNGWVTVSTVRITHTESSELHYSSPRTKCSSEMWFMRSSLICSEVICPQPKQKYGQIMSFLLWNVKQQLGSISQFLQIIPEKTLQSGGVSASVNKWEWLENKFLQIP